MQGPETGVIKGGRLFVLLLDCVVSLLGGEDMAMMNKGV